LPNWFQISITLDILSKNEFIPFSSESTLERSYKDTSGEIFTPMSSQYSQRYLMHIETRWFVIKEAEEE
jgi:uncharacterized Zn-finger protein